MAQASGTPPAGSGGSPSVGSAASSEMDDAPVLHLLTIKEVFVFKIPPLQGSRGHHAADWNLDNPALTGQLRVVSKGDKVYLQILQIPENSSGLPQLFASCPIKLDSDLSKPSSKLDYFVQSVVDSSRYFVVRLEDEVSKRHAYIGIGFQERQSAFDLRAALDDEVRRISRGENFVDDDESELPPIDAPPAVDRSLKDGETIKVKINIGGQSKLRKKSTSSSSSSSASSSGGGLMLKPPKASSRLRSPPGTSSSSGISSPPAASPASSATSSSSALNDSLASLSLDPMPIATPSPSLPSFPAPSSQPPAPLYPASVPSAPAAPPTSSATSKKADPFDELDFGDFQ